MALRFVDFSRPGDHPDEIVPYPTTRATEPVSVRELNTDPDTGGRSMVVTFPAGFEADGGHWSCDVEMLLLEGSAALGQRPLERYGYLFVPAGVSTAALAVGESGATALVFTSGPAKLTAASQDAPDAPRHRLIGPLQVADVAWEQPKTRGFPAGAGRKTLRDDTETEEGFWILGVLPHWTSAMTEWHAFTEENYILEGGIETAAGVMGVGCYLSHAAGEESAHGPMRSRHGSLLITRAKGPLETTYEPSTFQLPGQWH